MASATGGPGTAVRRLLADEPDAAAADPAVRDLEVVAADRVISRLGPSLALRPCKRRQNTVLILDGMLVPIRDHAVTQSQTAAVVSLIRAAAGCATV